METSMESAVTVYCGASLGEHPAYADAARQLGQALARSGMNLVYGGASTGLMGCVADAALLGGSRVTGVIPQSLVRHEVAHTALTDLRVVRTMHERKALMAELGDAFVAMPGGFGTAEELFEVLTWAQLGLHSKPCALLNTNGYYTPLLRFLEHAADEGFVHRRYLGNVIVEDDPHVLLSRLASHRALPHLFEEVAEA
ncbi:TIGR00730 family Rossman fold protein [Streptomyces decoyicus]|uniref:LOG family protein n=1 Tax=Streptomyces decoyicus TaxID=249567 RepID=UPI002E16BCBE|nr:TIGR00730 family Rossman fold protein [Streptomyces decoyicus]